MLIKKGLYVFKIFKLLIIVFLFFTGCTNQRAQTYASPATAPIIVYQATPSNSAFLQGAYGQPSNNAFLQGARGY